MSDVEKKLKELSKQIKSGRLPYERAYLDISDDFARECFDYYDPADIYMNLTNKERKEAYRVLKGIGGNVESYQLEWMKKAIWRVCKNESWDDLWPIDEERKLTTKQRNSLKDSDFGIPSLRSYPLNDKSHVIQAVRMFNHVDSEHESELANNLKKAIKKFNLDITVGDDNRFKHYLETGMNSGTVLESVLMGRSVRSAILGIHEESDNDSHATTAFMANASRFNSYLKSHYDFVMDAESDIEPETRFISNFFISVKTRLSGISPEESVVEYGLEKVVTGGITTYGIGGPEEIDIEESDLAHLVSDLFYVDAKKFGLIPVITKNSRSIMTYSKDSYYYRYDRGSDGNLVLRLEFYTDFGAINAGLKPID